MRCKTFCLLCLIVTWTMATPKGQILEGAKELILPVVVQGPVDQNRVFETRIDGISADFPDAWCLEGFSNTGGFLEVGCLFAGATAQKCASDGRPDKPFYRPSMNNPCTRFQSLQDGWIRVSFTDSESFQVISAVKLKSRGSLLTVAAVPAVSPAREFFAPALKFSSEITAYAIVNPSRSEAALVQVQLTQFRADGTQFTCQSELSIPSRNKASRLLDELLRPCQLPPDFLNGILRITSNVPIAVATLKLILPDALLVTLPTERVK